MEDLLAGNFVTFGMREEDELSLAASEGVLWTSEADNSCAQLPSGKSGTLRPPQSTHGWMIGIWGIYARMLLRLGGISPNSRPRHVGNCSMVSRAYTAAGHAAPALHAMAILQVHQAKALKDINEGGHDLAFRVTKVTASGRKEPS